MEGCTHNMKASTHMVKGSTPIIIDNKLILELKSVEALAEVHYKQLLTYLRLTKLKLGLLINFNVPLIKNGIHRIVNNL